VLWQSKSAAYVGSQVGGGLGVSKQFLHEGLAAQASPSAQQKAVRQALQKSLAGGATRPLSQTAVGAS
jgi:hypothetical protein